MERHGSVKHLSARYWFCCVLFNILVIGGFGLILTQAFRLQILENQVWVERAQAQTQTTLQVPTYRGSIYDRHGRLLSYSIPLKSLYADGEQLENPKKVAVQLSTLLGEPQDSLERKLCCSRHFIWIKRHLTDQQAAAVESLNQRGLNLTREHKRFYPYSQVGGQILGFVGLDGVGLEGIEKAFDHVLRQNPLEIGQVRDGVRKRIWLKSSLPPEPEESMGVTLTIDTFIQHLAEIELEAAVQKYHARAAEVVVMDAQTSEILAMANWPLFDPNSPDKKNPDSWRNRIITDSFEPGSTFKIFLVSAALDEGVVKEKDRIFCENGKFSLTGHVINDVHPHGWVTITELIKFSSNIGASKLALQMGCERFHRYIKGFGFGSPTGVSLSGEVRGLLRSHKRWRPIDLAVTGFGQSIGVTAIQLNSAVGVIARDGEYCPPIIAREIVDAQGKPIESYESKPVRRVIQKKTAEQIRAMMHGVTLEGGTGTSAAPEGYTAAGKTGTAQILDPVTRRYASNKYTSLFTGFVPADKPRLVITVVVHEPHGAIYGGVVAAPVFRNIAAKTLPYLGIMPSVNVPPPAKGLRMTKAGADSAAGNAAKPRVAVAGAGSPSASPDKNRKSEPDAVTRANNPPVNPGRIQAKPRDAGAAQQDKITLRTESSGKWLY